MEFRDFEAEKRAEAERAEAARLEEEARRRREEEERRGLHVEYFEVPEANYNLKEKAHKKTAYQKKPVYVLSARRTESEIRASFTRLVSGFQGVDADFVKLVKNGNVKVEQLWFEVWYGTTTETRRSEIVEERTTYYGTPDSTGEIRLSHKVERRGTGRYQTYEEKVKKYTSAFSQRYYSTITQDTSRLMETATGIPVVYAPHRGAFKNMGSDLETLEQVLIWPIWRVSVEYLGETYVNYLSDETCDWEYKSGFGVATLPIQKTPELKKRVCGKPGFWRNFFKIFCFVPIIMGILGTFSGVMLAERGAYGENMEWIWLACFVLGTMGFYFGSWCAFYRPYRGIEESKYSYQAVLEAQQKGGGYGFRNVVCPIVSLIGWLISFVVFYLLFIAG